MRKFATDKSSGMTVPTVVTGDFNSVPYSDPYQYITEKGISLYENKCRTHTIRSSADRSDQNEIKFICDGTLSKLCMYLRILGINTAMEKTPDYRVLFNRARNEGRILLTASKNLRGRSNCPRSTLVNTRNLEDSIVLICREYAINLKR